MKKISQQPPLPVSWLRLTRFDMLVAAVLLATAAAIALVTLTAASQKDGLRVAYMKNSAGGVPNIWVADAANPAEAQQVTFTQYGVYDYAVSADGRYIAYSERDFESGLAEIKVLDLNTGMQRQLTNCIMEDSDCITPAWRPDGRMIAYQRISLNTGLDVGISPNRIWLLDLSSDPAATFPLFEDPQVLGYSPVWSADGSRLAFYDSAGQGILIYDFAATAAAGGEVRLAFIPTGYGTVGAFAPDSTRMIFPEMLLGGPTSVHTYLQVANLDTTRFEVLTSPDENADDQYAAWHPDGQRIAILRRYLDTRFTRGWQIYLLDTAAGSLVPLVYSETYNHSYFSWSPDGRYLLMQRFPILTPDGQINPEGRTEIWTYDMETRELRQVADDAYIPRWVP